MSESPAAEQTLSSADVSCEFHYAPDAWSRQPIRLKLLLGELKLGDMALPGLVQRGHFADRLGESQIPGPPDQGFPEGVDVIKYPSFPTEEILPRIALLPGIIRYVPACYRRHYIDMAGTFADYLRRFSSKSRGNRRREVRRFEEFCGGKMAWRKFCTPEEMQEFHRLARQVSQLTYQDRLLKAGIPDNRAFIEHLAQFSQIDAARGYVLFHGTKPVSFIYCSILSGAVVYRYIGYNPEYKDWSPGSVLFYLALESLFAERRYRIFDFTEGEGAHKEFFANRSARCADILYCRRTPRILAVVAIHCVLGSLSQFAANRLRQIGLISFVKKRVRGTRCSPVNQRDLVDKAAQ